MMNRGFDGMLPSSYIKKKISNKEVFNHTIKFNIFEHIFDLSFKVTKEKR